MYRTIHHDHHLLLNHILSQTNITPELITRGTKLIVIIVGNIKFPSTL